MCDDDDDNDDDEKVKCRGILRDMNVLDVIDNMTSFQSKGRGDSQFLPFLGFVDSSIHRFITIIIIFNITPNTQINCLIFCVFSKPDTLNSTFYQYIIMDFIHIL